MRLTGTILLAALAGLAAVPPLHATPPLQHKAKDAGFKADDCRYCHTFDTGHMWAKAKQLGISNLNCAGCHGARLPKSGPRLMNARGLWLSAEKKRRGAERVDAAWLKDYVEPQPSPARGATARRGS